MPPEWSNRLKTWVNGLCCAAVWKGQRLSGVKIRNTIERAKFQSWRQVVIVGTIPLC